MNYAGLLRVFACLPILMDLLGGVAPATDTRPNILVILADDMGFSDIGCYGGEISTPNIDALAAGGVRFTQFYNTARCSPTRASLLTGLYPHQAGMGYLDGLRKPESNGTHGRLHDRCVTMAEVLRPAGYHTSIVGKWHLGQQHGTPPWQRGFQRTASTQFGELYFPRERSNEAAKYVYLDGRKVPAGSAAVGGGDWYSTLMFTDWALKFVDDARSQNKPFFLYFAHGAPHFPLKAPGEVIARYRGKYRAGWDQLREDRYARQKEMGIIGGDTPLSPRPGDVPAWDSLNSEEQDRFDQIMAVYAAMIDCIDQSVGRMVQGLRQRGMLENTLVLFLSDNGGNAESGPRGITEGDTPGGPDSKVFLGMCWATLNNTPFRRYKHFTHEGGIATPLIAHWPAGIPAERNSKLVHQPGHLVDVMATAVDLSGAAYPTRFNGHPILPAEGISLAPAFQGRPLVRDKPIFWEHEGNRAVRNGPWKLVMKFLGPWELYNIGADRTEQHNLAAAHPEMVSRLAAAWEAWAAAGFVDPWEGSPRTDWGHEIGPEPNPPQVQGRAFTVRATIESPKPQGVVLAHGGKAFGYSLYFVDGKPAFAYRNRQKLSTLVAEEQVSGTVQLAATVNEKAITLKADGKIVASHPFPGLLGEQPGLGLYLGFDGVHAVGNYEAPNVFNGRIISHAVDVEVPRATTAVLSVAMSCHPQLGVSLDNPARAADMGGLRSGRPASAGEYTLVDKALRAMDGAEEIVFVVRDLCSAYQWYATFGEYADEAKFIHAPDGSQLCKLNLRTRQMTVLLSDPEGGFRDPRVHYEGAKVLFAYRPGGTHHYHLCEINVDGSGFRQLTSGECDDVDPAYLPDGGIVFASSRCNRFVACNRVPAAILYRMDADGSNVRCLSANTISEDRPAVLPDGRIVYTRWDYTDRDPEKFRDLWVMNPDGTGQMVLFGGVGRPYPTFFAKCDALPVPGAGGNVVSVFSPAFGHRENAGNVMLVDLKAGPGQWSAARQISPELPGLVWSIGSGHGGEGFRDPYPLSADCFLVARDKSLLVLDANGAIQEFYRADKMVHDPRVIRPRPREPVLPPRSDPERTTGQLVLTDVYRGRNMAGVKPGTIKKLLVLEDLPKPGSKHGLPGFHGGYITLRRVLGTVPVEADGSASFEVPALRAVYFAALDENGVAVKRMQNFTTVMPGETQGCVGCHEPRTESPDNRTDSGGLMALKRPPNQIAAVAGVPDVFDYPRDIQPIWDRHCVACHNSEKPEGRVVLTGDNNEWFTQSYSALLAYDQVSQCSSWGEDGNHPPYGFGTGASPLMQKIDGSHYDVKLKQGEYDKVRLWIETGAGFTGTYAVFNHPENAVATPLIVSKPELGNPVAPIVERRCLACHGSVANLGRRSKQQQDDRWSNGKPPTLLNYPLYCWNLYNLSNPESSMILRASLSDEAGGYQWCRTKDGQPAAAFRDTNDPDYQAILQAIQAAKVRQERYGRPDIPGFRPGDYYVRWMKRFGVLPESFDLAKDRIDPYETDQAYWRSLWYEPHAGGVDAGTFRARIATVMKEGWKMCAGAACWMAVCAAGAPGDIVPSASPVKRWEVAPTSLVARGEPPLQRIDLTVESGETLGACELQVWSGERLLAEKELGELIKGTNAVSVLLKEPQAPVHTRWVLSDGRRTLAEQVLTWNPPRHWTLHVLKSAHVDIGLHDSQYKQRLMGVDFIDQARRLADETAGWPEASRYRYVVEGLWWWLNYPKDRSEKLAGEIARDYVKAGIFDIGASHSGNHTQVYGMEELCRSAYYLRELRSRWDVPGETMLMVDNNGITWPLVTAYADAGIKNLAFLPNAWNPTTVGGTRIDVGWDSKLPHLFYWHGPDGKSRLLVWANPHYISTGDHFGIGTCRKQSWSVPSPETIAPQMAKQLALLESRYPYDVWLVSNYDDNETPNLRFPELAKAWNARWRWPELRTVGDLSEPFREVEKRFGERIPTLRGDITGGWAQHPLSTPPLLAKKRAADRLLPVAETLATLARLVDPDFVYPSVAFRRAWDALVCNDEHGYGTSYYKGRPVYDTWMQKRDWIDRGLATAQTESARALTTLAALAASEGPSVFVFNPTLHPRCEIVEVDLPESCAELCSVHGADGKLAAVSTDRRKLRFRTSEIPPIGYAMFQLAEGDAGAIVRQSCAEPPSVENEFYQVTFGADGSMTGIFDKQLKRQLIDASAPYRCNQFVYTRDVHKSFSSPANARFEVETCPLEQTVVARMDDPISGAAIEQRVTLPTHEKRIDIDNRLDHVRDLASKDRWQRFGYYAFPFDVPDGEFRIGLNGCVARPRKDQTGHGTEAYLAARDWANVGSDRFGVTLVQYDSCLVECGKIHADKKAFGEPLATTHLYSYVLNDWLYEHAYVTGPSSINLRYRYVIHSHDGTLGDTGVARFAERAVTPLLATVIPQAQEGKLGAAPYSFLSVDASNVSLLTFKLSETPGRGVIARFHGTDGRPSEVGVRLGWGQNLRLTRCSIIEKDHETLESPSLRLDPFGYATLRIESQGPLPATPEIVLGECSDKSVALRWAPVAGARQYHVYRGEQADFPPDEYHLLATTRETHHTDDWLSPGATYHYRVAAVTADARQGAASRSVHAATESPGNSPPAKVGSCYTGLITDPRAWRGDEPDTLYLQWGQNTESDLSHYELYRDDTPEFELGAKTFLAKVEPGPYVVVPFEDKGLKPHTPYYYRVLAVDRDGHRGQPSDLCRGVTREPK